MKHIKITLVVLVVIITALVMLAHMHGQRLTTQSLKALHPSLTRLKKTKTWEKKGALLVALQERILQSPGYQYRFLGVTRLSTLQHTLAQQKTVLIKKQLIPLLKATLESQLKNLTANDADTLYNVLKASLLIGKNQLDTPSITLLCTNAKPLLTPLIKSAAKEGLIQWSPDKALLTTARHTLKRLPLSDIAFLVLRDQYSAPISAFKQAGTLPQFNIKTLTIPTFYASDTLQHFYTTIIPTTAPTASEGNWVTGKKAHEKLTPHLNALIISHVQSLYLNGFRHAWTTVLTSMHYQPAQSLEGLVNTLTSLSNTQSTLWALLNTINTQATLSHTGAPSRLSALYHHHDAYKALQLTTNNLIRTINNIVEQKNRPQATFDACVNRFQNNGLDDAISLMHEMSAQLPSPLNQWTSQVATQAWQLILNQTASYLNTLWVQDVYPQYANSIKHHFPVFSNATQDTSLKDFTDFFAPNATLDAFTTYYLNPFLNIEDSHWSWKTIDGLKLPLPQSLITNLVRATLIQKMFYAHTNTLPDATFTLAPIGMTNNTKRFTLNLTGQQLTLTKNERETATFHWPAPNNNYVTIAFKSHRNHLKTSTFSGPWGWLRLLQHANIMATEDGQTYHLYFSISDFQASYALTADNIVNAYLPQVLNDFRLPSKLSPDRAHG